MHAKITNTSRAPQGVWTADGLRFIQPGEALPLTVAADYIERVNALPFLTVAGDVSQGSTPPPVPTVLSDAEEIELNDAMTDDELRDMIERKTGKRPHHRMGRAKLIEAAG